ncbi:uncharacterized protein LOC128993984 isoform X2 [Macrosteles quadrilineatus]|uniref:uncharacterized protein LOC128993984 isoform X2 n=1 Tax=Macrosteles quadrilineatus TaxID=74068 RepID=UPI0023E23A55|nr:uncharacterized protein LOC128993984 isoform X2 [Macrosteles quadrilineatus]
MDNPQDCLVTSSQDIIKKDNGASTSGNSVAIFQTKNSKKKKSKGGMEQFSWFHSFQKQCQSLLGNTSMKDLLNAITVYTEHISRDVEASYSKPNRAAKLKSHMISVLNFFHNQYILIKQPFENSTYLEKMSNLLTFYFDMEVKASRRGKESVKKITSKLISALFIMLNDSSEFILDTILKARFTVKSYSEICIPIFKMVTGLPQSQEMNYVRCLLVFKIWKRMLPCREERNCINRLAVAKLSPPPAQVLEFIKRGLLTSVLPNPPPDKTPLLLTRFYMTKKFNLRESVKAFLKLEADLKLNDFTSSLDAIRFFDDEDEEDKVNEESHFEKDYSLLESIWIDISNSPPPTNQPCLSSSPSTSTSGSASSKVSVGENSRSMEIDNAILSKVKKSLFKSKVTKKNKQTKTKVKEKKKKNKQDLVIDLCKDNDDICSDITQNPLEKVKLCLNSSSKSAFNSIDNNVQLEVNSTEESKLGSKIEKNLVRLEQGSKISDENQKEFEVSSVSKLNSSCTENNMVFEISSQSKTNSNCNENEMDFKVADVSKTYLNRKSKKCDQDTTGEIINNECEFTNTTLIEAKSTSNDKPESIQPEDSNPKSTEENREEDIPVLEPRVMSEEVEESNDKKSIESKARPEESHSVSEAEEVDKVESSINKIIISCKNFSRMDYIHEELEEKTEQFLDGEPGELTSLIEISEDPIFKTEILKEDSLDFKEDDTTSDKLLLNPMEEDQQSKETWNNGFAVKPVHELSTVNNNCINSEINSSSVSKPVLTRSVHEESKTCNEKQPNKPDKNHKPVASEVSKRDNLTYSVEKDTFSAQNCIQEPITSKQNTNKTEINQIRPIKTFRDVYGQQHHVIVPEKPFSAIHKLKVAESVSVQRRNSSQDSSDVSSSLEDIQKKNNVSNLPDKSFVTREESSSCKVEKDNFQTFSSCMQTSESTHKEVNNRIKEKCDKNIQVPSNAFGYVVDKPDFIESSNCLTLPDIDKTKKQDDNIQPGLNTCLLHKILGEEDCLKSGCLLKSSVSEQFTDDFNKSNLSEVCLKQELENSTELPGESVTPTNPSLWNPSAGIKVEKNSKNISSLECTEGIRKTSSEFLVRSVTEACNFKELDIASECDNFTASCEFESDNEDRNLVIDEDMDSIKDHNETEDGQFNYRIDYVHNNLSNNIASPVRLNNNIHGNKGNNQLVDQNIAGKLLDSQVKTNLEKVPIVKNTTKENEPTKKELVGKHKLPKIVENNIKTSYLRNSYITEASVDSSIKYRPLASNEVSHTAGNSTQNISSGVYYGGESSSVVSKNYTTSKIVKPSGGNVNPACRVYSPHRISQVNDPNCVRINNRDPRLGPVNINNNTYEVHSNINVQLNHNNQRNKIKSLKTVGATNQPVFTAEVAKSGSPRLLSSPGCYETYTQYDMGGKISVPSKKSRASPVERYNLRNPMTNEKYKSQHLEPAKPQENCSNNSRSNIGVYAEMTNSKGNSSPSFLKYPNEHQTINTAEPVYETVNLRDPLCLVKGKEDPREMYDFEFNVFPIAQEIEICSGSGDWIYPVSSEIGHPDWPIAIEQSVIDSSASYSQPSDQYTFSLMKGDEGCIIAGSDQKFYAPLELQQVDNRHPSIVGENVDKETLNLHLRTLEADNSLCCSQREFKEFYLSRDVSPTIPVPFPTQGRTDILNSTARCLCEQCSDNHQKLLSNYNLLTHYRNSKIKPLGVFTKLDEASYSEKDPNGEFDSSLPLKKRKTLTNSKASEELLLPSYPNTPMISIAQLELTGYEQSNQVIVPNPQSQWRDAVNYNPLNLVQPTTMESFEGQTKGKRKASKRRKSSRA